MKKIGRKLKPVKNPKRIVTPIPIELPEKQREGIPIEIEKVEVPKEWQSQGS